MPIRHCRGVSRPGWLVVDGNNVMGARADGWWRDPQAAAARLIGRIQQHAATLDARVLVVLDRPHPDYDEGEHAGVVVRYAQRRGRDAADDRIVDLLVDLEPPVEVVTSDRDLADRCRDRGATVTGAGTFLARLDRPGSA